MTDGIITMSVCAVKHFALQLNSRVNDWLRVGLQANLSYTKYGTNSQVTNSSIVVANPMSIRTHEAFPYDSPYYYTMNDDGQIHYGDRATDDSHYSVHNSLSGFAWRPNGFNRTNITANLNL